jgi:hypothetical protein
MSKRILLAATFLVGCVAAAHADPVTAPIKLFNGKNLDNFYTYLQGIGKNKDEKGVFTVKDGAIRVSGEIYGCFTTEKEFENYHLVVEFKWGTKTWGGREKATMDSGILLHCVGEDGGSSYNKEGKPSGPWMESIECQMIEGGTGDFILVGGKGKPKVTATVEYRDTPSGQDKKKQAYYNPKGEAKEFSGGRINWFGRDPDWKDVKGFRGKNDVEKVAGEWNTLECVCDGDKITNILNGVVVNACTKATHTKGKILFQSEGAEVYFRRIELLPLKK